MAGEVTFAEGCDLLEPTLRGSTRQEIVAELARSKTLGDALAKLRSSMRSHAFRAGAHPISFAKLVRRMDFLTQADGFHVLIDWDGKALKWLEQIIPLDVLDYYDKTAESRTIGVHERRCLAILLDYYLLYVLALMCMRVDDDGRPDDNLDRLTHLIEDLQGPAGSGQKFVDNPEALILIATSHFEPDEQAYDRLAARMTGWNEFHRRNVALVHSAILASHLRHGFMHLYKRDVGLMRDDNDADYPGLIFSLLTLMHAYASMHDNNVHGIERQRVVEGLINGLTADPRAFVGNLPRGLKSYPSEQREFCETFHKYKHDLFDEFEEHRPSEAHYSPIAFNFNFPHNLLKGMVVDAVLRAEPGQVTLNQLFTGIPRTTWSARIPEGREEMARSLMGYADQNPDRIGGRLSPVIHYEPLLGLRCFMKTIAILKEQR